MKKAAKIYDVVIIGAGTAGMAARNEISKNTNNYLVIENGPLGTTCARVGCMPSKAFIEAAHIYFQSRKFSRIGVKGASRLRFDSVAFMKHVRSLRDHFVQGVHKDVEKWISRHLVKGHASFFDENTLNVDGQKILAKKFIVATGSRPRISREFQDVSAHLVTTDQFFEMKSLPKKMAVIGAGAIGLELAQALAHLNVDVTVFGDLKSIAGLTDPALKNYVREFLEREMKVDSAKVQSVQKTAKGFRLETAQRSYHFEQILLATGRVPNLESLALQNAGIDIERKIDVDPETLRVPGTRIYFAGDVSGYRPVLHEATDEGRIAAHNALSLRDTSYRRRTQLLITFTHPQIAVVGKSYKQLRQSKANFVKGEIRFENQGRALTKLENAGVLRIYGDKKDGTLLGAEIFAPEAEHLAHHLGTAIDMKLTVADLLSHPFYHPVLEEGMRTALRRLSHQLNHKCTSFELARCEDAITGA